MMHFDFILGGYMPADSFYHQADPRIKLLYTLYGMIVIFLLHQWFSFLLLGITVIFMFYSSKIRIMTVLKAFKSLWILFVLAFVFPLFNNTGEVIMSFGVFTITEEALNSAFIIISRLGLLIGLSLLMTATTSSMKIADSTENILKKLGFKKIYAHETAMIMSLAIRFIPIISMEANQIIKAQKARGAKFDDRNLINRVKALFPVIIPLLVGSFKRAEELALSMDVRYYNGYQGRTKYFELKLKPSDYFLLMVSLGIFTFILYLDKVMGVV